MTEFIRILGEKYEHTDHIVEALVRKIARDTGDPLPKAGTDYYLDRPKEIIFGAFVEMIASNSGVGIHNCDQDHPTYHFGARGKAKYGDGSRPESVVPNASELRSETSPGDLRPVNLGQALQVGGQRCKVAGRRMPCRVRRDGASGMLLPRMLTMWQQCKPTCGAGHRRKFRSVSRIVIFLDATTGGRTGEQDAGPALETRYRTELEALAIR